MARLKSSASNARVDRGETSLDAAMRAPSTTTPDIVVLDFVDEVVNIKEVVDPKKDLWLSSVDGRHQSPIVPVRVGPHAETFHVHRDILTKSEYFRKALDGEFREAGDQSIDLPEENPTIFSFVIAFLYEDKYMPIKPVSAVLVEDRDKGKGKETSEDVNDSGGEDETDSGASLSDESGRSRRRREIRRRRQEREFELMHRKEPGRHRPDCNCRTCTLEAMGPSCWNCGGSRRPPRHRLHNNMQNHWPRGRGGRRGNPGRPRERHARQGGARNDGLVVEDLVLRSRMSPQDLHTWCLSYSLSVDVYVCAERYLMNNFKASISDYIINNFEIAGLEAAHPSVLQSCKTLHHGVSPMDPLLKMVFARVGFLQARLWKNFPEETAAFFIENADLATLIMKEMIERRDEDVKDDLPAMDRAVTPPPLLGPDREYVIQTEGRHRGYDAHVW